MANRSTRPRHRFWALSAFALVLAGSTAPLAADQAPDETATRVGSLIRELGDDDYFIRERAQEELARLGFEAFDALSAAEGDSDLEIASRATYLLRSMEMNWTSESDPAEVRELLKSYKNLEQAEAVAAMTQLASLPDEAALPVLCRFARFERSPILSRRAALAILDRPAPDAAAWPAAEKLLSAGLGASTRPAVAWIRAFLDERRELAAAAATWESLIDAEEAELIERPGQTTDDILMSLVYRHVDRLERLGQTDRARPFIARLVALETGEQDSLAKLMEWLVERQAWQEFDELTERFADVLEENPLLLYTVAEAHRSQDNADRSEQVVAKALLLHPDNQGMHYWVGRELWQRGQIDWAERELRLVIDIGPADSIFTIDSQRVVSEWVHDRLEHQAAAELLSQAAESLAANIRQGNAETQGIDSPDALRARTNYFWARHYEVAADPAKQLEHLETAIGQDPLEADVLIALYRASADDPPRRERTLAQIGAAVETFRRQIAENPANSSPYNQLAWLVANTEGDQDDALRCSLKSLEIQPDSAGLLDTLAHCYFARKEYQKAVEHQTRAVELEPYSRQIRRKLDDFTAALESSKSGG